MSGKNDTEIIRKDSEERLRIALESAGLGTLDCDLQSQTYEVFGDERTREIFGLPARRVPLDQFLLTIHPEDRETAQATIRDGAGVPQKMTRHVELRVLRPNGEVRWVVISGKAIFDNRGPGSLPVRCIGTVMDITEHKNAEDSLARDLEAMTRLQELGSLFVREGDLQPVLEQIVEAAIAISGADFGNIQLYDSNSGLEIAAQRGFPQWYLDYWNQVTAGNGSCGTALAAGQRVIVVDVEESPVFAGTPGLEMQRRAGVRAVQSTPVMSRAGKALGMFSTHFKTPHMPDEHALKLLDLLARRTADIIERAQTAKTLRGAKDILAQANQDLEDKVRERTGKLEETIAELEGFSYSLVHDMRGPLRAMLGYATILQTEAITRLQPEEADLLRRIGQAAKRMDELVVDSLNYSQLLRHDLPVQPIDLRALIQGLVQTYPNLQPPQAEVSIEMDRLLVCANEAALIQIFSNLLGNAVKFVAPGVKPRVHVSAIIHDCPPSLATNEKDCVFVWIEDNGIGIPKYAHERIFGMFQRMHRPEEYPGTGIGLALVKKSLERTGGEITLESEPGKGSRFCVQLPLAVKASEENLHAEERKESVVR